MSGFSNNVKTFGIQTKSNEYGSGECFRFPERPPTPEKIKKYRDSYHEPGKSRSHHGVVGDNFELPSHGAYGRRNVKDTFASDVLGLGKPTEHPILSTREDSIGKAKTRNYKFPQRMIEPSFMFGCTSEKSESSKKLIYPKVIYDNTERDKAIYRKCRQEEGTCYEPGEQKKCEVDWSTTSVKNPNEYRFGITERGDVYSAQDCFKEVCSIKPTRIISSTLNQFKKLTKPRIGKCTRSEIDPNMTFGSSTNQDRWGTKECIHGWYKKEDQQPKKDLGRATRIGYRNNDTKTTFGVNKNKDEVSAAASLKPVVYFGVTRKDFDTLLNQEKLMKVVKRSGVQVEDDEHFIRLFEQAHEKFGEEIEMIKKRDNFRVVSKDEKFVTLGMFQSVYFEEVENSL